MMWWRWRQRLSLLISAFVENLLGKLADDGDLPVHRRYILLSRTLFSFGNFCVLLGMSRQDKSMIRSLV